MICIEIVFYTFNSEYNFYCRPIYALVIRKPTPPLRCSGLFWKSISTTWTRCTGTSIPSSKRLRRWMPWWIYRGIAKRACNMGAYGMHAHIKQYSRWFHHNTTRMSNTNWSNTVTTCCNSCSSEAKRIFWDNWHVLRTFKRLISSLEDFIKELHITYRQLQGMALHCFRFQICISH